MDTDYLTDLFDQYKQRDDLLYQTWFIESEHRIKAFNQVRKGVKQVVATINAGTFPPDLKGSALEIVMDVIAGQTEIFKGAKHAFMWKPKMRIPDIYENRENQLAFAQMLDTVVSTNQPDKMLAAVNTLANLQIKGLGPAVANILYFLEPSVFVPFNTAIVKGYNTLTGSKLKLGKWGDYFKLRDGEIELNQRGQLFSKDLGAMAAFLFDIGKLNYAIPENADQIAVQASKTQAKLQAKAVKTAEHDLHQRIQFQLATLGNAIGYRAWIASNDHSRLVYGQRLGSVSMPALPKTIKKLSAELQKTIGLIDVIWFDSEGQPICAFEVEKSTSIMSGMNRMDDLSEIDQPDLMMYIVSPDQREQEVQAQFMRPHYMHNHHLHDHMRYILFADLEKNCDFMKHFGKDYTILAPISHYANGKIVG